MAIFLGAQIVVWLRIVWQLCECWRYFGSSEAAHDDLAVAQRQALEVAGGEPF
jgi:hypothetical protein